MDEVTWHHHTRWPLLIASALYLVAYSWRVIADLDGTGWNVATLVLLVTWAMFIVDYVVRLALARGRGQWFRRHLGALVFALIPVLRLVMLLRVLTLAPAFRATAGAALRTKVMIYGAGASALLLYLASLAVLEAERDAPGATIVTFGDALWWASATVTTTGFGDLVPITLGGRLVGAALMFGGIAMAGVITATLASWIVERASRNDDSQEPATRGQLRTLITKVDALAGGGQANGRGEDDAPPRP